MSTYLRSYCFFLVFASLAILPVIVFLINSGELDDLDVVIQKQLQSSQDVIYGTVFSNVNVSYKTKLLKESNPKVIALGSSRVMQFQSYMFNVPFVNLGGAMNSINEGEVLVDEIINKKPSVVIIGLDIWWFNESFQPIKPLVEKKEIINVDISPSKIIMVFKMLYTNKIQFDDFISIVLGDVETNNVGLNGIYNTGFSRDGSYKYTRLISGDNIAVDMEFKDTLDRMKQGDRRFQYESKASEYYIYKISEVINKLKKNNIEVIAFFPPFAEKVNDEFFILRDKYTYVADIKNKLNNNGVDFFDFSDAKKYSSSDCEFIDGFHGGEVTYARILLELKTKLDKYVSKSSVNKIINTYNGYAASYSNNKEIDFNNLGCRKNNLPLRKMIDLIDE